MTDRRFARTSRAAHMRTALIALIAVACSPDRILQVEDIDVALPPAIEGATALPSLLAGAIGDFGTAYNGGVQSSGLALDVNQVAISGLISDELINTETFPTRIEIDQRQQQYQSNGSLRDAYYAIHQARASADRASEGYLEFGPTELGLAESLNLGALSLILLAENYCGAVPISRQTSPGVFEYGSALSTTDLFTRALAKADSALAHARAATTGGTAAAKSTQERLARIVRARALLNLDRPVDAGTNLGETEVPTTFQYFFKHSEVTTRQNNGTWLTTASVARYGVADREGTNGLPFRSEGDTAGTVDDPRVANFRRGGAGVGFDGVTAQWIQTKHGKRDTLAIIADGVEARLIQAEAALRAGQYPTALTIMNDLRANTQLARLRGYVDANQQPRTLPALLPAATPVAQQDQLFKERAYWLYLTSHRLGDLRRLVRQYLRGAETVFPTGTYHKPGTYGTDVNSPIPQAEDNNPDFERSACVTTQA